MQRALVLFCSILISISAFSQTNVDSLKTLVNDPNPSDSVLLNSLYQLSLHYTHDFPDTGFKYAEQLFHMANDLGDKRFMGIALNIQGNSVKNKGEVALATEYYSRAARLFEEVDNHNYFIKAKTNYAQALSQLGQVSTAMKILEELISVTEAREGQYVNLMYLHQAIAGIHYMTGDYPKSIQSMKTGVEFGRKGDDPRGLSGLMSNLGYIQVLQGEYFEAMDILNEGLEIAERQDSKLQIAHILGNIGNAHFSRGEHDLARDFYRRTMETVDLIEAEQDKPAIMYDIGVYHQAMGEHDRVIELMEESLQMALKFGVPFQIRDNSKLLATSYRAVGKFEEALNAQDLYLRMSDSLMKSGVIEATMKKEMQFEYEKQALADSLEFAKEQEIQDLQYQANLEVEKNKQYGLYGGIGLLLLLGGLGFKSYQNRKKDNAIILAQKAEVEEAHREITDSIHYAKRIQAAVLPPDSIVKQHLPGSFILYKPKDIVAGDFYWLEEKNGTVFFASADCTGHGVPGAMVSVVCVSGLNRALREMNITDPGKILDKTRELVVKEFEKSDENVQDGMDIALCSLNGMKLQYAGAHNPLWIVRNGELLETKADKQPIGKYDNPQPYTTHSIDLQLGDTLYIFSDGYPDQFGGEKGKKYKSVKFKETLIRMAKEPISDQKQLLDREFENWRGDHEQIDDVCVIGVKV